MNEFIKNQLKLSELSTLNTLNGLYFKDLPPPIQRKFNNASIRVIIFSNMSTYLKEDLLHRFN